MFIFMIVCTLFVLLGCLLIIYLMCKIIDEVVNLKLLMLYLFKSKLSEDEIKFIKSFESYSSFHVNYNCMIGQCNFFGIDKPDNVREGLEIMMEFCSYN